MAAMMTIWRLAAATMPPDARRARRSSAMAMARWRRGGGGRQAGMGDGPVSVPVGEGGMVDK